MTALNLDLYLSCELVSGLGKIAGCLYLTWLLNARQLSATPRRVIVGLWLLAIVPAVIEVVAGTAFLRTDLARLTTLVGFGTMMPLFYAAAWTAYLLRSERVANTYTPGGYEQERMAAVFE